MRYIICGILGGLVLYVLLAIKDRLVFRVAAPDERIRSLARIGSLVLVALVGWEIFDYFFGDRESSAAVLALIGVLGGFQLGAEAHWHTCVGRYLGRKK